MPNRSLDVSLGEAKNPAKNSLTAEQIVAENKVRTAVRFLLTVCLSLMLVALWQGWTSRQYRLQDKEVAMANLAQTLSSQAKDSIKQADTVLFSLVDRIETEGMGAGQLPC